MPNSALRLSPCASLRACGPAQAQLASSRRLVARGRIRRAFVEHHHDVGIEHALDLHRDLGREEQLVAVDRRRESDAVFADLAQRAEAEHLEAARIGENRPLPAHEAVQPAVRRDDVDARAQPQVKRVAQDDLRADVEQFVGRHRLDRAVGADRHEDRRVDDAVRQRQSAAARRAAAGVDREFHGVIVPGGSDRTREVAAAMRVKLSVGRCK